MSKLRLGLLFGGRSVEHEVSLQSARSILAALNRERYTIHLIAVDREGCWRLLDGQEVPSRVEEAGERVLLPAHVDTSGRGNLLPAHATEEGSIAPVSLISPLSLDVIFPIVHGAGGEDGSLQGLLELAEIAYVGSGVLSSSIQMDKDIAKKLLAAAGLPVLPWMGFRRHELEGQDLERCLAKIEQELEYPLFVKPANSGSSVGINKVSQREELSAALREALRYDDKVIVERGVVAREVEVAVLGNEAPRASIVGEIVPRHDFYDYQAKYQDESTKLLIPAPLETKQSDVVRELAIQAFEVLDAEGMARVDFLIDRHDNRIYVNELNSLPGFTAGSMYPLLWEATGLSYGDLLDQLVDLAIERRQRRAGLKRSLGANQG